MAAYKYKVKKGDSFASLGDAKKLMQLNPGVPSLSAGRVIKLPQQGSYQQSGLLNNAGYKPPTNGPFAINNNSMFNVGNGLGTPINPLNSAANVHLPTLPPVEGGRGTMLPNRIPTPVQGGYQQSALLNNAGGGTGTQPVAAAGGGQPDTTIPYTGGNSANDKAYRLKWNKQADPNWTGDENTHVYTMSKSDVWNMKAAQRRRQGGNGMPQPKKNVQVVTPVEIPQGNAVNASLHWRAG